MPARARSSAPAQSSPTRSETASPPGVDTSQDEARQALKDGGSTEGLENYQASLGQWLGTELYNAIAGELTFDKLSGYATDAWESALASAVDALDELDGQGGDPSLDPFRAAIQEQFGGLAAELMDSDIGHALVSKLNGWVDAHPRTILLVALLAAAGAVAANVEIPKLEEKLKLGRGFTAKVGLDLGRIREIALKEIRAELEYASGPLIAAIAVDRDEEGEVTYGVSGKVGDDSRYVEADGTFTSNGLDVYGIRGLYQTDDGTSYAASMTRESGGSTQISATVTTEDGETRNVSGAKYDAGSGVLTLTNLQSGKISENLGYEQEFGISSAGKAHARGALSYDTDALSASAGASIDTEGTGSLDGNVTYTKGNLEASANASIDTEGAGSLDGILTYTKDGLEASAGASIDTEGTGALNGRIAYTKDDLKAFAEGEIRTDGSGFLSGSASNAFSDKLSGSARLRYDFGKEKRTRGGLDLTYRGDEWSARAEYGYDSLGKTHTVGGLLQKDLGDEWKIRGEGSLTRKGVGAISYEAGGSLYKKLNPDVAVFGGGVYRSDKFGERFVPKAGMEVKGIPVEYSYDPKTKQHNVGVTLFRW